MHKKNTLVFTDLDGSLLDHNDYNFDSARPLLAQLEQNNIAVIANSSKTRSEIQAFRSEAQNTHPFIVENGAAVFIPIGYFRSQPKDTTTIDSFWVKEFIKPHQHWMNIIKTCGVNHADHFSGFTESGITGVVRMTGLSEREAKRASAREYGEPLAWHGSETDKSDFVRCLQTHGAATLQGGRFLHVSGHCNKGIAMTWLKEVYTGHTNEGYRTIAIGDSGNDVAMLDIADHAIVVHAAKKKELQLSRENNTFYSSKTAPDGWVEGIEHFLKMINQED